MLFDEKIFTVEVVTNTQNDRLRARDAGDLPEGSRSLFRPYETRCSGVARSRFWWHQVPFWSTSRKVSRWTRKLTLKCWQKKCYPGSLKVLETATSSHRIWLNGGAKIISAGFGTNTCMVSLKSRHQQNELCYLVHLKEWCLDKILLKCGCSDKCPCFMVCFGWTSGTAFMPLSYQSFGTYGGNF